ncbi:unnamed protein product [Prorocentrum cordatum]|uniref:Uncharacterized protein n=1 Tax=Prorocentrum cordatum TaxID=2364126 RepID=A0ABN9X981_9DINO|nr:unnamed protein product [Polarella glacialis]
MALAAEARGARLADLGGGAEDEVGDEAPEGEALGAGAARGRGRGRGKARGRGGGGGRGGARKGMKAKPAAAAVLKRPAAAAPGGAAKFAMPKGIDYSRCLNKKDAMCRDKNTFASRAYSAAISSAKAMGITGDILKVIGRAAYEDAGSFWSTAR